MKNKWLNVFNVLLISLTLTGCTISFDIGNKSSSSLQNSNNIVITIDDVGIESLFVGDTLTLIARINGEISEDVYWTSSDENVIEIDDYTGELIAKQPGFSMIYASYINDESRNSSISLEVKELNNEIHISITNKIKELMVGNEHELKISYSGSYLSYSFISSNEAVAQVDREGFVIGKSKGQCVISVVSNENKHIKDEFSLNVLDDDEDITSVHGYDLVFADYFDGDTLNTNYWSHQLGNGSQYGIPGWGNDEQQYYQQNNASVRDGKLIITARKENVAGYRYTSSRICSSKKIYKTYGRIEAKIKLPLGKGLWPAFWLLPNNSPYGGWPNSGEIDIMEAKGRLERESSGALHFANKNGFHNFTTKTCAFTDYNTEIKGQKTINDYHIYALEWDRNEMRWFVDDYNFMTISNWTCSSGEYPSPFNTDFYIVFNLAIGGMFDNHVLPDDNMLPAEMCVDYVKWYQ